jgi:2-polyprenyl-6-methoxyphenol hydroxylase-like FAD-dependent oxidoreductase
MSSREHEIIIIGGGIGGLTLALSMHKAGLCCRVYEAAPEILPLGVGLNLLPHAMVHLNSLGLELALLRKGIEIREYRYFTRLGQLIQKEPRGCFAGHQRPQISIHRAELYSVLLEAVRDRLGPEAICLNHRCVDIDQDEGGVTVAFAEPAGRKGRQVRGRAAIACDGIHSVVRAKYHPEARLRYEGTTQYRGTTRWPSFLSGATMIYVGTIAHGKLVMYPIRNNIDTADRQLINWVIEVVRPAEHLLRDWTRRSEAGEFIHHFSDAHFPWLDVTAILKSADAVFEYPMVDQDPLQSWTSGLITLLGDAAHPMMPRGSNGAAQAILDAAALTNALAANRNASDALKQYEELRLQATSQVVIANRTMAPDAIIELVEARTQGRPFRDISDVIGEDELRGWQERYQRIAGFAKS